MVIGDALKSCVKNYPNKTAVKDEYGNIFPRGTHFSYQELDLIINRLSNNLLALGLKKGDRVAVQTSTGAGYFISLLTLLKTGLVIAPIDRTFMPDEIQYQITDSGAKAFILDTDIYIDKICKIKETLPSVKHFIGIGDPDVCEHHFQTLLKQGDSGEPDVHVNEDDIATLIYTSGTTGCPKGVPLTHQNWLTSTLIWASELSIHPYTRWALVMPLHTSGGTGLSIISACRGCTLTLTNPDPEKILSIIEKDHISFTQFSPTLLANVIRHPNAGATDFSSIKTWFTSAAPISSELLAEGAALLGDNFIQLYGTTETALMGTVLRPQDVALKGLFSQRLTSVGKSCFGYQTKVVDANDNEVGPGGVGELAIKGRAVARSYWNKPDADDFKNGWWYSGDLVKIDMDGFYYVVDRKKDMIVSGGLNIYPREVEDVIASHPAVHQICVVGIPDDKWGESVKAVIVLKPDTTLTENEIFTYCSERMAPYKKPKSVDFIDISQMPMTGGGYKVLRRKLRDRYRGILSQENSEKAWGAV